MNLARVIGNGTATEKHPSLTGWKLLILQPLDHSEQPDGLPIMAIDSLGAGRGDQVMFTSDGSSVRELVGARNTPVRYAVCGIADS